MAPLFKFIIFKAIEKKQPEELLSKEDQEQETLQMFEKKLEIDFFKNKNDEENPKPRNSLDFLEKQEEIMKNFQDNFINIYEGKPIDISEKKTAKTNNVEEKEKENDYEKENSILPEKKEKKKKNPKKQKIQKVLQEISKKKANKNKLHKNNIRERDCCNSKIIRKPEKVMNFLKKKYFHYLKELSFWEKFLITFGCVVNKNRK